MFNVTGAVSSVSGPQTLSGGCWHSCHLSCVAAVSEILRVPLAVLGPWMGVTCESKGSLSILAKMNPWESWAAACTVLVPPWVWPWVKWWWFNSFSQWELLWRWCIRLELPWESQWTGIRNSHKFDLDALPTFPESTSEDFGCIWLEQDHGLVSPAPLQSAFNST